MRNGNSTTEFNDQEQRATEVSRILQAVVDQMEEEKKKQAIKDMFQEVIDETKVIYDLGVDAGFDTRYAFALASEYFNNILF